MSGIIGNFESKILYNVVPYPLGGMIYYVETSAESNEAWIANKPIQYIDEEGYHCGWGLATLCFKFEDLNEVYFFSREEAQANLGGNRMRLFRRIKTAIVFGWDRFRRRCQRFKRGWSYGDVWDMDYWFMRTVKPMLIHLRDNGIGVPNDLYIDGAENEREAWEAILTEMVSCLTLMDEDEAEKYLGIADDDYSFESYQKVTALMDEKKDRFFELFSKYFYNLWD